MRKHFTSGECVRDENVKRKDECVNRISKMSRKGEHGITLIALVITIIVMLVLAGVSINAIIGDNGVITNAQNAQIAQSCALLEEWLQEKYVDEASDELVSGGTTRNTFVKIEK